MNFINFSRASCRNCYKCLRSCPVKAVRINNEQAEIDEKRCIACGHCMVICPQNARNIVSDVDFVMEAIKNGKRVVASIAPSFYGAFDADISSNIVCILKEMGFSYVEETASAAGIISDIYMEYLKKGIHENLITTSCPAANNLVEKYYPGLIKYMIPAVSPMIAHGRIMKKKYGMDSIVVFIGPCITKKHEALDFQSNGVIDAVLTFEELNEWILQQCFNIKNLNAMKFDSTSYYWGRSFPLKGGITDGEQNSKYEVIHVEGMEECIKVFDSMKNGDINNVCIVANACIGGCIGGPGMPQSSRFYKRRKLVNEYAAAAKETAVKIADDRELGDISLKRVYFDKSIIEKKASDRDIEKILRMMGKYEKSDELNCGVCGYDTCRRKAQAVYEGMAEISMCLHHMRTKAESLTNIIFENTPNIIIILDGNMNVRELNPPGEKVFNVKSSDIKGSHISQLFDGSEYYKVKNNRENVYRHKINLPRYGLVLVENILYLEKQDIILGIMTDITKEETAKTEIARMREKTLDTAQQVINRQMMVAQQIAGLLGETTAETKMALTRLKKLVTGEDGDL